METLYRALKDIIISLPALVCWTKKNQTDGLKEKIVYVAEHLVERQPLVEAGVIIFYRLPDGGYEIRGINLIH